MAKMPEVIEVKIVPDTSEAEKKLAHMAVILTTLETRAKRLEEKLEQANISISRKETDKRG